MEITDGIVFKMADGIFSKETGVTGGEKEINGLPEIWKKKDSTKTKIDGIVLYYPKNGTQK